jgi:N-acetylmuramoyl-L-alanine amidase
MVVSKLASIRMVALAAILTVTFWQSPRAAETATRHTTSCAPSTFRVLIDVGHTATSPGADSARGEHEYEFNLKLADIVVQSLRGAGFEKTVRLVRAGVGLPVYSSVSRALTTCTSTYSSPFTMTRCRTI